jgi:uncharacterized protein YkwD
VPHALRRLAVPLFVVSLSWLALGAAPAAADATADVVAAVNQARAAHGLRPVRLHVGLDRSAGGYAYRLAATRSLRHSRGFIGSPTFRVRGEVIGWTARGGGARVVRLWLRSPSHRAVLLGRGFRYVGVGVARSRGHSLWVGRMAG